MINRNYLCDVKLTVRGGFDWELEQCGVFYFLCFVSGVLMCLVIPCVQNFCLTDPVVRHRVVRTSRAEEGQGEEHGGRPSLAI